MTGNGFSFYWHDYETFGTRPAKDRPAQFAGIRTDCQFNPIGKPLVIYCQPSADYLPDPEACLITGITPQQAISKGIREADFIRLIYQQINQPNTCSLGYNNLRFDDEITRYTLYRNFYDPYEREWQHGNSRWDLIDVARACYALAPQGIKWATDENGIPSFRLERLTKANAIEHNMAHDALSDVYATIALAKLLNKAQPKLFASLFYSRTKQQVVSMLNPVNMQPVVHVSGMLAASQGCASWMVPVCRHPKNNNAIIMIDLNHEISPLVELGIEEIIDRLYCKKEQLGATTLPIPIKLLHINRCPIVVAANALSSKRALKLGINPEQCRKSLNKLKDSPEIKNKLLQVFSYPQTKVSQDIPEEQQLYSGSFFSNSDKKLMTQVRNSTKEELASSYFPFQDSRLAALLFRYRARNFPDSLNGQEQINWWHYCQVQLEQQVTPYINKLNEFAQQVADLTDQQQQLINALYSYVANA